MVGIRRFVGLWFSVLFCWFSLPAIASSASEPHRGLAWEVRSPDGKQTAVLMGAMHLAKADFYPLNPAINQAFDASDILLVEADEEQLSASRQQALLEEYAFYPAGQSYRDHLSQNVVEQLETMFESLGFVGVQTVFARYRPGLLGVTLAALHAQVLGYTADYGIDRYFLDRARGKKMIEEIEGYEFQIKLIGRLPSGDKDFSDSLLSMADFETEWARLEEAWKTGDGEMLYNWAIADGMRDFPRLARFYEVLFFERNKTMAERAEQCMARATCFVVVGAGHLVGPQGMVSLLQSRGFKLRQL